MKTSSFKKGNFTYHLNYDEREQNYSFVVYVKIRSRKRKEELKSSRAKDVDICFKHIDDDVLKKLSDKNIEILKSLMIDILTKN
ncbi:TPA: hypothetical protein ACGIM3_004955 [Salmonella enterica subsp. enterica serovar Java]